MFKKFRYFATIALLPIIGCSSVSGNIKEVTSSFKGILVFNKAQTLPEKRRYPVDNYEYLDTSGKSGTPSKKTIKVVDHSDGKASDGEDEVEIKRYEPKKHKEKLISWHKPKPVEIAESDDGKPRKKAKPRRIKKSKSPDLRDVPLMPEQYENRLQLQDEIKRDIDTLERDVQTAKEDAEFLNQELVKSKPIQPDNIQKPVARKGRAKLLKDQQVKSATSTQTGQDNSTSTDGGKNLAKPVKVINIESTKIPTDDSNQQPDLSALNDTKLGSNLPLFSNSKDTVPLITPMPDNEGLVKTSNTPLSGVARFLPKFKKNNAASNDSEDSDGIVKIDEEGLLPPTRYSE